MELSENKNMQERPAKQKSVYRAYTRKEKLVPSILLALFGPLTLLLCGPFEIYANNMAEFKFVLWDFWMLCGLGAMLVAAALFAILMLLRGRAFDVVYGALLGLSLMIFVQGNYLSYGVDSLAGDGVGETISLAAGVVNVVIWVIVIAACVTAILLLHRFRDTVRLISTVALVALMGMTFVSFLTISLTTDVYTTDKSAYGDSGKSEEVLTVKNLDTLATENNVVFFIVDRFDHTYFEEAIKECPEIFDSLEGFTHFSDYVTRYPRTYPAVTHIVTGEEVDFTGTRLDYLHTAYANSDYLAALKAAGSDINVYTDSFYGYENAASMNAYVSNTSENMAYDIVNRGELSLDMVRISMYRYVPFVVRHLLGNISTPMYEKYVDYRLEDPKYTTDMKDVYEMLTADEFTFRDSDTGVSYIHVAGCHMPNVYGADFEAATADEERDPIVAMKQSFAIISAYIKEMKRMGVYENATIIITGDHSSIGSDKKPVYKPHVTTLLAKPAGVSQGAMVTSTAQIAPEDLFATVLAAVGAEHTGRTVFEIPENEVRTRYYMFQMVDGTMYEGSYANIIYEITGSAYDLDNWKIVENVDLGKNIYD